MEKIEKLYQNCELTKNHMFKDNKGKSLVYRWINKVNGKSYIGSTSNFTSRFYKYFSISHLEKNRTTIHNALLKYGYSKFDLEILEYCDKNKLLDIEQKYLDLYKPEYNILEKAESSLGFKHSKETIERFKNRKVSHDTRKNLSISATGRILNQKEKSKISEWHKKKTVLQTTKDKLSRYKTEISGVEVKVTDINTGMLVHYDSLTLAARSLKVSRTAVSKCLITGRLLKKIYKIEKINNM